jgi:beta-mannanase
VPWAELAAGAHDAVIDAIAARVKALGLPVLMDFTHEPEEQSELGTPQQFAAAYRHVVQRFRATGADNVSWVWTVMGYSGHYDQYAGGLYPGDDVVDWIGWDPYNWYVCHASDWKSFAHKVSGFYDWLLANGHADKPFMLSEYGSAEHLSDPLAKGAWFRDALSSLTSGAFPNLKALVYFDSNKSGECDWRLDSSSASLDGYRQLAADPYLNP